MTPASSTTKTAAYLFRHRFSRGIHTLNLKRAHRVARALRAGTVWVNTYNMFDATTPFGGYKSSGFGREGGPEVMEYYTQYKSVWIDLS